MLIGLCCVLLVACDDQQCVCTLNRVSILLTVLNPSGLPEPGVSVQTTLVRTGAILDVRQPNGPDGVYSILDDSFRDLLEFQGDALSVVGRKGGLGFTAAFVARPDGPCRCHIQKMSGPESVTLQ